MSLFKSVLFLFLSVLFSSVHSSIITFTNQSDWEDALSGNQFIVEQFDGPKSGFASNSSGNTIGNLYVSLDGIVKSTRPTGLTGTGFFESEVRAGDALAIEFSFDDTYGFALSVLQNDKISDPSNLDLRDIALSIDGFTPVLSDLFGRDKSDIPFLGFVSDTLFNSFDFIHAGLVSNNNTRTTEEFYLDGLVLAVLPVVSVAEPPMILILLTGLCGLLMTIKNNRARFPGNSATRARSE